MKSARILVWDLPVRVSHWLLAVSFIGAFLTAESESARNIHVTLGYTVLNLIGFRLLWGFVGSRHARWHAFLRGPTAVVDYLRSLLAGTPRAYAGHNPAGGWVICTMLALGLAAAISGLAIHNEAGGKWLESLHEAAANALLVLVLVHIAGVLVSSVLHRENLVAAMLSGRKSGSPRDAIARSRWVPAVALAAAVAVLWSGLVDVPGLPVSATKPALSKTEGDDHSRLRHKQSRRFRHEG